MKGFYEQFEGELEGHALVPEDLKGGTRGIGSYFRKLRDGRLIDKDVLPVLRCKIVSGCPDWAAKTSPRKIIIRLAESSLLPLLQDAERLRPQKNRTVNSCRLSLQHLQQRATAQSHIDEEVRTLNHEHNSFLLSDTNALLHKLVHEGFLFRLRKDWR